MALPERLVIVEDDRVLREELRCYFELQDCVVHEANSYHSLLDVLQAQSVDAVVLDLNLPGINGYDISQHLRASMPHLVIVMLTARTALNDKIKGYEAGADVYFPKPTNPAELLAAIRSLVSRQRAKANALYNLALSPKQLVLRAANEQACRLSAPEAVVLQALLFSPHQAIDAAELQNLLDQRFPERPTTRRALENTISRLRKKLQHSFDHEQDPIKSVRGIGYQLTWRIELTDA